MIDTLDAPAAARVQLEQAGANVAHSLVHLEPERPRPMAVAAMPTMQPDPDPIIGMMQVVVARGGSVDELNKLADLRARLKAERAEELFIAAMTEFKKNPPVILKDKHVEFGKTAYDHATHFGVTDAIVADLAKVGISHRWDPDQTDGKIAITCILTHVGGHSTRTRMEAGHDNSGGKNSIQAIVSAKQYLERHTLLSATGLSTKDKSDDDGRGFEPSEADKLLDRFIDEARATKSDADALAVWKNRNAELAKYPWAHKELKAAVTAHRDALKGGAQ